MNKAKERAISHLSHELKTPLALISAILTTVSAKLVSSNIEGIEGNVAMVQRNLDRLLGLQQEIDNIINENATEYRARISRLVEDAFHFVEYQRGVERGTYGEVLGLLSDYIGSIYKVDEESSERLSAHKFLRAVCQNGRTDMADRQVEITENMIEGQTITANRSALEKVFDGILRNAVENTPDEGRIEVTTQVDCDRLVVQFRDFGTGITPENQNLIFTGFFHTQDTDQYSTKTPYAFNAGGSGADLLRAKVFSERYGFTIDFESTRCAFIPKDTDECPGRISLCKFIADESGCHASGTVFTVSIPLSEER
jgi:signal transduction histidine kinase